jgi:phage terminase large subunit GpA-like protein
MYVQRIQTDDGKWVDTDVDENGVPEREFKLSKRMFFWWNSEVSPFRTFHQIWSKFIETRNKLHDYRNFIQCWEASFWIDDISKTTSSGLKEKGASAAIYTTREVPAGIKVLTAGIDTQDDGFAVVVRGFGEHKLTALIDAFFIQCNMSNATVNDIVAIFSRDILGRIYRGTDGVKWQPALVGIDTGGHRTGDIYKAASPFNRIIMVKGRNNQNLSITFNKEINLYLVRTCEYLDETENLSISDKAMLPSDVSADYCTQFCNIRKTKHLNKRTGETTIEWKKTGRCDYRMADVHCFICLDVDTQIGRLRGEIEKPNWKLNMNKDSKTKVVEHEYKEEESFIGTSTKGWL